MQKKAFRKETNLYLNFFTNFIFLITIALSILFIFYAVYKIYQRGGLEQSSFHIYFIFFTLIFIFINVWLIRTKNNLKIYFSLVIFSIGFSLYSFELYMSFYGGQYSKIPHWPTERLAKAKENNLNFDTRTKSEVIEDFKNDNITIYPEIHPLVFLGNSDLSYGIQFNGKKIFPLGGVSRSKTISCNEQGSWLIYDTDKFGFNNPKEAYLKNFVDIVVFGDSFAKGWCVESNENVAANLRKNNLNVLNYGIAGSGPLIQYAAFKEYIEPIKPKIVIWFYFMNDLYDMTDEIKSPLLINYLNEENYNQELKSNQNFIDSSLKKFIQEELNQYKKNIEDSSQQQLFLDIIKLSKTRGVLNLIPNSSSNSDIFEIYFKILKQTKTSVDSWGGELYVINLPSIYHVDKENFYKNIPIELKEDLYKKQIESAVESLDISYIDMQTEVFDKYSDPLSLFPFKLWGHYNEIGYQLISNAIFTRLNKDNKLVKKKEN